MQHMGPLQPLKGITSFDWVAFPFAISVFAGSAFDSSSHRPLRGEEGGMNLNLTNFSDPQFCRRIMYSSDSSDGNP